LVVPQSLKKLRPIREPTGEAVQAVNDNAVDPASLNILD
jgi:hypothetical protein